MLKFLLLALMLLPVAASQAGPQTGGNIKPELTVFTAKGCGYCRAEMAYLNDNHIPFKEISLSTDDGRLEFDDAGGVGTPLTVYGKAKLQGYTEAALVKFLFFNQASK